MNYAVSEFKAILEAPRRLAELEEARGQLLRVFAKDGFCIAAFVWGCCSFPEELEGQLREMVGEEVAILRLDGSYHARAAE